MNILVTGAYGFIGSNLVDFLLTKGYSIKTLDIKKRSDLPEGVSEIIGDITREDIIKKAIKDVDIVIHLASLVTEKNVSDNKYWEVNVRATYKLLQESKKNKVCKFIYCSSDSVSGQIKELPAKEDDNLNPENIYGITKNEAEKKVLEFKEYFNVVIIRPTRAYGPRDKRLLKIFQKIKQGRFFIVGKGDIYFHPIYITDLLDGFLLALDNNINSGEVFYIGGKEPILLDKFLNFTASCLGKKIPKIKIPLWLAVSGVKLTNILFSIFKQKAPVTERNLEFFTRNKAYDITKAREILGYNPKVDYKEGIKLTIDWYKRGGYI